jgi:hypothetical protein
VADLLCNSFGDDGSDDGMDDLQRMVYDMYGGNVPKGEADALIAERRLEAKREFEKMG